MKTLNSIKITLGTVVIAALFYRHGLTGPATYETTIFGTLAVVLILDGISKWRRA